MVYDIVPFACVCCIHNPFSWKGFQSRLLANLCWNEQSTITHVLSNMRKRSLCRKNCDFSMNDYGLEELRVHFNDLFVRYTNYGPTLNSL